MGCGSVSKDTTKTKKSDLNKDKTQNNAENFEDKMDKKEIADILDQSLQLSPQQKAANKKQNPEEEKKKTLKFEIELDEDENKEKKLKKFQKMQERMKKQQEEQQLKKQQILEEKKNQQQNEDQEKVSEEPMLACQKFRMSPKKKVKGQAAQLKKEEKSFEISPLENKEVQPSAEQDNNNNNNNV